MIFFKVIVSIFLLSTLLLSNEEELSTLFEKVNQTTNPKEKEELIEELKEKLAKKNKEDRELSDAILKAKEKIPNRVYKDISSIK